MALTTGRRDFLLAAATGAGALIIGHGVARDGDAIGDGSGVPLDADEVALNGFVKVAADGTVTVFMARAEMGQGIGTGLAMLVAEEMDVPLGQVRLQQAPRGPYYANIAILLDGLPAGDGGPLAQIQRGTVTRVGRWLGLQVTGGSSSMRDAWLPLRRAGALARAMLVQAAATRWGVAVEQVQVEAGYLRHGPRGLQVGIGELAALAARRRPTLPVRLKPAAEHRLIGSSPPRLDGPAKVTGRARFGVDVRPPGLLFAALALLPQVSGARLGRVDSAAARNMRGVHAVVTLPHGVAVVADNSWRAQKAAAAVQLQGDGGPAVADGDALEGLLSGALDAPRARVYERHGDLGRAPAGEPLRASYAVPFLAHACMEPINCTAQVRDDGCTLWLPTQAPELVRAVAALTLGISRDQVQVHRTFLGGGFGRRADVDMVKVALTVARALRGRPVQVLWTREQDIRHGSFRPAARARFAAWLGADGLPERLHVRLASDSVTRGFKARLWQGLDADAPDPSCVDGCTDRPYAIPARLVEHVPVASGVPVGFWRSVGFSQNIFFYESFLDELAAAAGADPLDYRRRLLRGQPRPLAVLERAAAAAGWDRPAGPGRGRGIALAECFGSLAAQVVTVAVDGDGFRLERIDCALDCGPVVHPDQVRAQVTGSIVYALGAALDGRIDVAEGAVVQGNFDSYRLLRMPDMPEVHVHLLAGGAVPGGVGEPAVPPLAPALASALHAASGRRSRTLPLADAGWRLLRSA